MNVNDPAFIALRDQLRQVTADLGAYKTLYRNERDDLRAQQNRCRELEEENANLLDEKATLQDELDQCRDHINSFKVPRPCKKWSELTSPNTLGKRKNQYKECLEQSLLHLHEATRARVQLRIGKQEVFFLWSANDLRRLRHQNRHVLPPNRNNQRDLLEDIPESNSDADAFLPDGQWNEVHLRKIIHVMDVFKISFQGYHELRMVSNSILPPLTCLTKARTKMSHVITCLHHSTVHDNFKINELCLQK